MSKPRLTALQKEILDCLAQGMSTKEIVAHCGCSESSVKQVRANKNLRSIYSDACYEVIRGLIPKAIKELERILQDPTTIDTVKMTAVKQVLEVSRISDVAGAVQQDVNIKISYE